MQHALLRQEEVISLRRVRPSDRFSRPTFAPRIIPTIFGIVGIVSCSSSPPQSVPVVVVPDVAASSGLSAEPPRDTPPPRSSRRMWTWETDVRDARKRAKEQQLPLVVYLRADWSAAALEMDRNVWSDPRILLGPHAVVPLRIDVTDGPDAELWAEEFRVKAVPATIIFDADGRETTRFEGPRTVEEVLAALRQIEKESSDR